MERKPYVSKEQIERARRFDLLTYLQQREPHELVRLSSAVYSLKSHDSLKISNGKWYQWSTGIGGVSALDYLVKVKGVGFVTAVLQVLECGSFVVPEKPHMPKPIEQAYFVSPTPYVNNKRVRTYLMERGISEDLIDVCIDMGLLYEDTRHNCVFVGFDKTGTPKYAMLRSSDKSSTFLREAEGSDKRYAFCLASQQSETLYLFESAIDCLSFITLERMKNSNCEMHNYLSLSGVYQPKKELAETALPVALAQFLEDNSQIQHIALCLDNDEAGRKAATAICALLPATYTTELLPPEIGKDYNEQLMMQKQIETPIKTRSAKFKKLEDHNR